MKRLKELRIAKKLYQKDVASAIGIDRTTYVKYELGQSEPNFEILQQLADFFDVSVDYILNRTDIKKPLPSSVYPIEEDGFVIMHVLASVKAGYNGQAIVEYTDDTIPVTKLAYKGYPQDECVVMRVSGDSMYPKLLDGDYILVHQQPSVDSGSIAIVIYNGDEATVKKVRYKAGEDWVELIPTNPEYQAKRIEGQDLEQCHVFGLVLGLVYRDI